MPSSLLIFLPAFVPGLEQAVAFAVGVGELGLAALPLQLVQRRLREEDVAVLDQRLMNRNSSVSSSVEMCWPSTSASAISTIL